MKKPPLSHPSRNRNDDYFPACFSPATGLLRLYRSVFPLWLDYALLTFIGVVIVVCLLVGCQRTVIEKKPCWKCTVFQYYRLNNPNNEFPFKDLQTTERTCDIKRKDQLHTGYIITESFATKYTLTTRIQGICVPSI